MTTDEIIDKFYFALEFCSDSDHTPFTPEEYREMKCFLEAQRMPEHECHQWYRGKDKESRWKVGNILAYYKCYSDYEGEQILGEITKVEYDEYLDDWKYYFKNDTEPDNGEYWEGEERLVNNDCYKISKEYYEKHRQISC